LTITFNFLLIVGKALVWAENQLKTGFQTQPKATGKKICL
jgi:hypothetical protein